MSSFTTSRFPVLPLGQTKPRGAEVVSDVSGPSLEIGDESLIASVQAGDRDALSLLFRRYARPIRSIGFRILGDGGEAEDLVQEVFLYVHRKSGLFDSAKGSARSWIVQVAYTQAFLRRRHLKSRGLLLSGIADNSKEIELRTDSSADYDQSVEGLLGRRVLALLTEDQRETLRLYFFDGYTFSEIADKLGQSFCNVRHHYYRGLETVRKNLGEKTRKHATVQCAKG